MIYYIICFLDTRMFLALKQAPRSSSHTTPNITSLACFYKTKLPDSKQRKRPNWHASMDSYGAWPISMSCLEFAGKTCPTAARTDLDLLFDFPCLQAIRICKIWGMFWCFMVASQTGLGQTKDCRHKHAIAAICCRWTMVTMGYVGHGPCDFNIKVRPDPSSWLLKTTDDYP